MSQDKVNELAIDDSAYTAQTTSKNLWKYCCVVSGIVICGLAGILIWYFTQSNTFPDVGYVLLGYNLLKGYPLSSERDPGFTHPIFSSSYENDTWTSDLRYRIPAGFHIIPDTACRLEFTSQVVETSFELSESLSNSVSTSVGAFGLSFGVSTDFTEGLQDLTENKMAYIFSTATCRQYYSRINIVRPPPFSREFVDWVHRLDNANTNDKRLYLEFFDYYGTHFMSDVTFGSKLIFQYKLKAVALSRMRSQGSSVSLDVGFGVGPVGVSLGTGFGRSESVSSSTFLKNSEKLTITIGAKPPADGNINSWAASSQSHPVPIKFKLDSIENLFTKFFMSEIDVNYTKIQNAMRSHKKLYCPFLRDQGIIHSCVDIATEGILMQETGLTRLSIDGFERPREVPPPFDATREECFMTCFKSKTCVAVEFCRTCRPRDPHFHRCYMYLEEEKYQVRGFKRPTFETLVRPVSFENFWALDDTEIIGGASLLQEDSRAADFEECVRRCYMDDMCKAFTYCSCRPSSSNLFPCDCDDLTVNCLIYRKPGIKQLAERRYRYTVFIMR